MQQAGSVEIDDPVVKELPVYLSKALLKKLYVFQYPLRSKCSDTEKPTVIASRIKPNAQDVELEFKIPTNTCNYDRGKGEQICQNVDGHNKNHLDQNNFFDGSLMNKIIYTSTKALLDPGRYAVGMISKNELHLSPIHGILHVKASFPYLDKSDKTLKANETNRENDGADTAESADDEDGGDQVTVKFARTESDRAKATREKSFGYLQKKNAEEQWISTKYYKDSSEESFLEKNGLICPSMDDSTLNMSLPKDEYMSGLFGPCPEADMLQKLVATESMSMVRIHELPELIDRVKHFMINVKVTSFSRLCSFLDFTEENQQQDVLKCVQQVAELVRGNWVVKSDVLYPTPEKERDKTVKLCGLTGIHPEILSKARDFVLQEFASDRPVDRDLVTKATKIPSEEMLAILLQFADKKGKMWEFRLPKDQNFIEKFPDVVRRQELMSQAKQKQLKTMTAAEFKAPKKEPADPAKKTTRIRRGSRKDSCSSDSGSDTKKPRKKK